MKEGVVCLLTGLVAYMERGLTEWCRNKNKWTIILETGGRGTLLNGAGDQNNTESKHSLLCPWYWKVKWILLLFMMPRFKSDMQTCVKIFTKYINPGRSMIAHAAENKSFFVWFVSHAPLQSQSGVVVGVSLSIQSVNYSLTMTSIITLN